ncbi:sec-independent protein translocase protein TatA [Hymenobacter luteus]|uniref:Sec-independent protein translocase protein TatA n=2 Tax=Hymenobacter TaxID=89966 RepID=A0A7W9SZ34_9BACT|nr:twin-arginine translocase TatA/TatE family subunit [Hymenobacter latericoloratus]MBB4599851.1 sec-independent protein translocase protein TatA [Hymenobacter latericoloratus]MBB6057839.1 sec-independent protein translocase protein TatA [Hymenobacter luteus]
MNAPLFLFLEGIGGGELMVIVLFILIFFGANKIPELARGLGKGIREFKDASREIRSEIENAGQTPQPQQPYQQQFNQQPYSAPTPTPVAEAPVAAAPAPVAPPMDGGITPPVAPAPEQRPRLDQTT